MRAFAGLQGKWGTWGIPSGRTNWMGSNGGKALTGQSYFWIDRERSTAHLELGVTG